MTLQTSHDGSEVAKAPLVALQYGAPLRGAAELGPPLFTAQPVHRLFVKTMPIHILSGESRDGLNSTRALVRLTAVYYESKNAQLWS